MKSAAKLIFDRIRQGELAYEQSVQEMSNQELWAHCFEDGDWDQSDYCVQEWNKRDTNCLCTPDVTTGNYNGNCNICGKSQLSDSSNDPTSFPCARVENGWDRCNQQCNQCGLEEIGFSYW